MSITCETDCQTQHPGAAPKGKQRQVQPRQPQWTVHATALPVAWLLLATIATACSDESSKAKTDTSAANDATADDTATDASQSDGAGGGLGATDPAPDCEELDPTHCALPWPPPKFAIADPTTPTGTRIQLGATTLPVNIEGKQIDPKAWNRSDGWGVGTPVLTVWPDLDLQGLPDEDNLAASLAADSPIALWHVDADGKAERVPFWVEHEQDPDLKLATDQVLYLRPAVLLAEAARYVVAFRKLKDTTGKVFAASPAFAALRDGATEGTYLQARAASFAPVFALVEAQGWSRSELQLAWEFRTSSSAFLHGDMLAIRDMALATVGEDGPELKVTKLVEHSESEDADVWLEIEGTFHTPLFTEPFDLGYGAGGIKQKGHRLVRDAKNKPTQTGWVDQPFWLRIPQSARNGGKIGLLQYGHGLLGTGNQVKSGHLGRFGNEAKLATYASNWTGMANPDYQPITAMIFDFSDFYMLPERVHQGLSEFLTLARGMRRRLAALPELSSRGVQIDETRQFYTGDSKGGIYGATYVALSQEVTRAVLGVPGNNYSTLLRRSVDFIPYFLIMRARYDSIVDRAVLLACGQMLWDQVDPVSYLRHLSAEPFPNTPSHQGIFGQAKGDWQVANVTNENLVRSGVGVALAPHYGKTVSLAEPTAYPMTGSALVNWDFGNPWSPLAPVPPYDDLGDPHGKPRGHARYLEQMKTLFETGTIVDTCAGATCPGP